LFKVVEDTDYNDTITYQNDPTNTSLTLKISGGEGAICTGAFLLFSSDGKTMINLRPALQTGKHPQRRRRLSCVGSGSAALT